MINVSFSDLFLNFNFCFIILFVNRITSDILMLFNSINYIFIFLPVVFILYFALNKFKLYNLAKLFLLFASLYFYGTYKWNYVYIIICSVIFNYAISSFLHNFKSRKLLVTLGVAGNVLILFFFKYFNSLHDIFANLHFDNLTAFTVIMPLGISFFTLQQISYLVDSYKGKIKNSNLLDFALFICFFPQLVSGPIVRHQEMIPQFNNIKNKSINNDNIFIGIFIITIGLLKKTVFADGFVYFINYILNNNIFDNFYVSWFLGICKMMQLYFDFSGYCDLAIGSAFLFNISLPWNFNSPFRVKSITEYWKRWNMTLMRFLHEYVYKPLGADKKTEWKTNLNILIMFTTLGIWSGLNIPSILYGVLNGVLVCINRFWTKFNFKLNNILATVLTFISLVIPIQLITAKDISSSFSLIKSMLGINTSFSGFQIEGCNFVFTAAYPFSVKLNIFLFFLALYVIFFCKNSNQLARIYVKANNIFYTSILVLVFIFAALSITRSSEFLYFIF